MVFGSWSRGCATRILAAAGCYSFELVEEGGSAKIKGWIPMKHVSMEYTHYRDSWGCKV